jgi:hypothetical protein
VSRKGFSGLGRAPKIYLDFSIEFLYNFLFWQRHCDACYEWETDEGVSFCTKYIGKCNKFASQYVQGASKILNIIRVRRALARGEKILCFAERAKELETVTFDRHLPLEERLQRIDHIQARRYSKLSGSALTIATEGIMRHLRACDRMDVNPDTSAVREIIDDALNGRRVFAETSDDRRAA